MAVIKVDPAINVPDKPAIYNEIPDAAWTQIMKNIWLRWWKFYYGLHKDEIDASLNDFTIRVFEALAEKADSIVVTDASPDANVSGSAVPEGNDSAASQAGPGSASS